MEYVTIGFDHILVILHENYSKQLKRLKLSLRDMGTQPIVVLWKYKVSEKVGIFP